MIFRPASHEDATLLKSWYENGQLMAPVGFPDGLKTDLEDLRAKIRNPRTGSQLFMIEYEDEIIGEVSYHDMTDKDCCIGIKIDLPHQGKGLGKASTKLFVEYLFANYPIESIYLDPMSDNTRAIHLYRTIGFQEEKLLKAIWTDPSGRCRDAVLMRLRRKDG